MRRNAAEVAVEGSEFEDNRGHLGAVLAVAVDSRGRALVELVRQRGEEERRRAGARAGRQGGRERASAGRRVLQRVQPGARTFGSRRNRVEGPPARVPTTSPLRPR